MQWILYEEIWKKVKSSTALYEICLKCMNTISLLLVSISCGDQSACRTCRCGAGKEATPGMADTPGFPLTDKDMIAEHVKNGFKILHLKRHEERFKQTSASMLSSWRANCDVQILIYETDLDNIEPDVLARVVAYVTAYTCKGNASYKGEKEMLCNLVKASKKTLSANWTVETASFTSKLLNSMSSQRVISKGECSVELLGLDLYRCTEQITHISLSSYKKVQWNAKSPTTFNNKSVLKEYAKRRKDLTLSLNEFFYKYHSAPKSIESSKKSFLNGTYHSLYVSLVPQIISYRSVPVYSNRLFSIQQCLD